MSKKIGQIALLSLATTAAWGAQTYTFSILSGRGVRVCESYRDVLNSTRFKTSPRCGLPDGADFPHFHALNREYLKPTEVSELFLHVYAFTNSGDQNLASGTRGAEFLEKLGGAAGIKRLADNQLITAWRYAPQLNVNNDGKPVNIMMWHGYGASTSSVGCGTVVNLGGRAQRAFSDQLAYVLTDDNLSIDEQATKAFFAHPNLSASPTVTNGAAFLELGSTVTLFHYGHTVYQAAIYDRASGGFKATKKSMQSDDIEDHIGVAFRSSGAWHLSCELRMETRGIDEEVQ